MTIFQTELPSYELMDAIPPKFKSDVEFHKDQSLANLLHLQYIGKILLSYIAIYCNILLSRRCEIMKYANDISLVVPSKHEDAKNFCEKVEDEIQNIKRQSTLLNFQLNQRKSKAVILSRPPVLTKINLSIPVENSVSVS